MAVPSYSQYADIIAQASQRFGVDSRLIRGAMALENYGANPQLGGSSGEVGLMQVMGPTYAGLAKQHGLGPDRADPENNIMAGAAYLREGLDAGGGDWSKALAYYNAGPGGARTFLKSGDFSALPAVTQEHLRRGARLGVLNPNQAQTAQETPAMPILPGILYDPPTEGGDGGDGSGQPTVSGGGGAPAAALTAAQGGGLLSDNWLGALAAGMMSFGSSLRGGSGAEGMQLVAQMQKQQGQNVLAEAAKKLQGKTPDYDGAFALMMSHPDTVRIGMEMFPTMAKQRQAQQLQGFLASRLGGGAPGGAPTSAGSAGGMPSPALASGAPAPSGVSGTPFPGPQGGALNFTPAELAMLKAQGVDLTDIYKLSAEGIKRDRGADYFDPNTRTWTYQPRLGEGQMPGPNGTVTTAPGYDASVAATAAARTRAEKAAGSDVELSGAPASPGVPDGMNRKTAEAYSTTRGTDLVNQPGKTLDRSKALREEFAGNPVVRNRNEAVTAYRSIEDAANRDTLASDLNMVYGMAKLFDPGSVVREGETIMVNNAQSLPDKLVGAINAVNGGTRLQNRDALLAEARGRIQQHEATYKDFAGWMGGVATRMGVDPRDVLQDVPVSIPAGGGAGGAPAGAGASPASGQPAAPLPPGEYQWDPKTRSLQPVGP